jgi:hypothetical protein
MYVGRTLDGLLVFGRVRRRSRRSSELVIDCRRIKQCLPQGLRGDNLCQCAEATRFLAILCGRVAEAVVFQGITKCDLPSSARSDMYVGLGIWLCRVGKL